MRHVRQAALAHGDEEVLWELPARAADAAAPTKRLVETGHVIEQVVLLELHEDDVSHVDNVRATGRRDGHRVCRVLLHGLERAPHAHGEVAVAHGLDHEVQRVHLIALHGVLGEVGHEYERRRGIFLAKQLGGLHAVDAGQAYVHEDEVRGFRRRKLERG
ncbi:MAG: hypothetical protein PUG08_09330 [Parafannyhessea umbonata]|nr:hypothetical protein [Parafannyhessea umbonata]MDD6360146.1 hypothetical protein [Parafannyhessea umbonata]